MSKPSYTESQYMMVVDLVGCGATAAEIAEYVGTQPERRLPDQSKDTQR
jgi:hypothetical protein